MWQKVDKLGKLLIHFAHWLDIRPPKASPGFCIYPYPYPPTVLPCA